MAFEVVSEKTWKKALEHYNIKLNTSISELEDFRPTRGTILSAGYDFKIPFNVKCQPNREYCIPTGFKWNPTGANIIASVNNNLIENIYLAHTVLVLAPRSSLGFNVGFKLLNTIGVIDADYYNNPTNEGHIIVKFSVEKEVEFTKGQSFCQGIILPFALDGQDVKTNNKRSGGIGSTNK